MKIKGYKIEPFADLSGAARQYRSLIESRGCAVVQTWLDFLLGPGVRWLIGVVLVLTFIISAAQWWRGVWDG